MSEDLIDIEAAARRLAGHARRTPLLSSPFLDEIAGRTILIKAECLQHSGSFKFRGAWSAISALDAKRRTRGVMAFSSGNHAQGIAMAAKAHDTPATILMPSDAPAIKQENTRALGAEVILYDRATEDRDVIGDKIAAERGLTMIRPYDEPLVIAGQASVGIEIAEQAAERDIREAEVITCCGGGGLTAGVALALEDHAPGMIARTAEPEGFDDVRRSLASGKIERNAQMSGTICDAIQTQQPGDITFPIMKRLCGPGYAVSEEEALRAMVLAFSRLRIVLEPGGAVALAAALFHSAQSDARTVIAIASGGNVDPEIFANALKTYG
jgi:threonine dehydratase